MLGLSSDSRWLSIDSEDDNRTGCRNRLSLTTVFLKTTHSPGRLQQPNTFRRIFSLPTNANASFSHREYRFALPPSCNGLRSHQVFKLNPPWRCLRFTTTIFHFHFILHLAYVTLDKQSEELETYFRCKLVPIARGQTRRHLGRLGCHRDVPIKNKKRVLSEVMLPFHTTWHNTYI